MAHLIQPTLLEYLISKNPKIEKKFRKDFEVSKRNLKERLKIIENIGEKIRLLEGSVSKIQEIWERRPEIEFLERVLNKIHYSRDYTDFRNILTADELKAYDNFFENNKEEVFKNSERLRGLSSRVLRDNDAKIFINPLSDSPFSEGFSTQFKVELFEKVKAIGENKIIPNTYFEDLCSIKYYRLYESYLNKQLKRYKSDFGKKQHDETEIVELPKADRGRNSKDTILTSVQTALLSRYMKKSKIILEDKIDNTDVGKAFQILTRFSYNSIRSHLGDESLNSFKKSDFDKVKDVLQAMITEIDKDAGEKY